MSTDINLETAEVPPDHPPGVKGTEVNCLNVKVIYDYLIRKLPEKAPLLFSDLPKGYDNIDDPEEVLTDENNWIPSEVIVKMFQNSIEILDDQEAPYHIGYESITNRNFGYIQKFFLTTFGSPFQVLKRIDRVNSQFNTTKVVETIYGSRTRAVVRLHWIESKKLSKDLCKFNLGIYAAIPTIWKLPPATITEVFCQYEGDPYCQFNITFHYGRRWMRQFFASFGTKKSQLPSFLEQIENDKIELKRKYDEVNVLNIELADKIEKLKAINTASRLLVSQENTDEILQTTMNFIVNILQFDRAIIMLVDDERTYLEFKYAVGADPGEIEEHLNGYNIPLANEQNILSRVAMRGRPILVQNPTAAGLDPDNRILVNFGASSFVICPLLASEGIMGILATDRFLSKKEINEKDLDDVVIFANTIAETLHKAKLKEEIESSYLNTVRALVRTIEEKDAYTRGHSERVAELSEEIGKVLGMPERELEFLRIGCLLHDVGKIGIPESIVRSPKSLTTPEFNIIKRHPLKGAEIVKLVSFLKDHIQIIRNHHERYDGAGYPDGLEADEIPLEAHIACIADTFDAITSTRPYRKGLPHEEAASRIYAEEGHQFSPEVTAAFRKVYTERIVTGKLKLKYH